ncbi:HXXEE domain-containing protein [Bacillus sp. ISL-4]|uniref:HXXEE domain-containing protein n=1 Tax=Bacillus sp. ISL-4 TaxID=2819125 RepID=UPI001BE660C8|nr:HXXEE domain-containing protein [Bacillus sp. ISL-4]MBT2666547.1 HXXEE domain-containing protein [Bacillus sp. ISL-4]MBT2670895.1 HXXEE domain-containing protein [Streptomyces sp. ISL-14]
MLETFRQFFDLQTIIWLCPIIFIFHDLEEIITIESSMKASKNRFQKSSFVQLILNMREKLGSTAAQLSVSATWILLIISFTTVVTAHLTLNGGGFLLYTAILNLFILQAIMHVVQSIFFKGYTPGIITALFLLIPYCLIAYDSLFEHGLIDGHLLFASLPVSLLMIPIFLVGNLLGRYFIQ